MSVSPGFAGVRFFLWWYLSFFISFFLERSRLNTLNSTAHKTSIQGTCTKKAEIERSKIRMGPYKASFHSFLEKKGDFSLLITEMLIEKRELKKTKT